MVRSVSSARALRLAVEVVWWLSVAAVALAAVLLVMIGAHLVGGGALKLGVYFELSPRVYRVMAQSLSSSPASVTLSSGQLAFARPLLPVVLLSALVLSVAAAAWLFIVGQVRRLLAALATDEPFARANEIRLRRIGLAVIAFELGRAVAVWGGGLYLEHTVVSRGIVLRSHFGLDVPVILLGVLLLALAAAFRVGSQLAEEQALTV